MAACLPGCSRPGAAEPFRPVTLEADALDAQLAPLGRAIGDTRIVLLGENGHGVGELTAAKARIIEWLHRELDFDVVVMESGFFECGNAWRRVAELSARELLFDCLRYPFQQAEILPLFELIRDRHASDRPLILVPDSGGLGEDVYGWVLEHGPGARAAYAAAAALTSGWERWTFRLAGGLVERLGVRAEAMAAGATEPPGEYYELRDAWMARAVAALADSIAGSRKVVVWLHNDHARYGDFDAGPHRVRSVGGFLRERYGDRVFSIGFFMGRGRVADNRRREREVAAPAPGGIERFLAAAGHDAGYLILTGNCGEAVREWADRSRPYLRMGTTRMELVPAEEFDALFYVDQVGPPSYSLP